MFGRKKQKNENANIKENLVNFAFDTFLKEGEHYTVVSKVEDAVLVKKIARWAYCDIDGQDVHACFSIETDKGIYCFQVNGEKIIMVQSAVCLSMYPELAP